MEANKLIGCPLPNAIESTTWIDQMEFSIGVALSMQFELRANYFNVATLWNEFIL